MSQLKASDFPLLLEVFREGLILGIISKDEIVAWADNIIISEQEPDYFFIEISLSGEVNSLIDLLNQHITGPKNLIPQRVIFGLIFKKLLDDDAMTDEMAAALVGRLPPLELLTPFECDNIYAFEDFEIFYGGDTCQLQVEIFNFLSIYRDFSLSNYHQWPEINKKIEETLKKEQAEADIINAAFRKDWKKREAKRKLKLYLIWGLPALLFLVISFFNYHAFQQEPTISKVFYDNENLYLLDVFGGYFILRCGYWFIVKRKRR